MRIYNKYKKIIEYVIYPLALLVLPLMKYNQGVDVSDSTYSLGNYLFADRLEGMWVISTYLSNTFGSVLIKLPGATNLRIANVYTGLILGLLGLIVYLLLRKDFDSRYVFLGEFAAICFCWIPTGILYNYLSYFVMVVGALLLYKGIVSQNYRYELVAGLCLGINVFVRIPNITQMALIVALWFACYINRKNCVKDTTICICGYAIGLAIPGIVILAKYKLSGIQEMITGLSSITSTDETYTPLSMILGPIQAYILSFKWIAIICLVIVCGTVMFKIMPGKLNVLKTVVYLGVILLMLRFFWGRGMFSFRYYEDYSSMYEWGVITLYLSIVVDVVYIIRALRNKQTANIAESTMAVISLVVIMIAPLGSNNKLYQNLNNLFLVMPFTMYVVFGWIKKAWATKKEYSIPVASMLYALLICITVQSFGFSQNFVFRDGMRGEKRDTQITGIPSLEGMYTNSENANALEGLYRFISADCKAFDEMILFGDCPGLTYVLNKPCALYSSWIDLDSNPIGQMEEELDVLKASNKNIPVIIRDIEGSAIAFEQKKTLIENYISEGGYELGYSNDSYKVYVR